VATTACVGFRLGPGLGPTSSAGSVVEFTAGTLSAVFGLRRIIEHFRRMRHARLISLAKNFNFMRRNLG
jgi:hypothetical protein